tara:strand:+ start:806 stop:1315 length:510 start_codon:yes stop_codon:yes gene_type:complete
MNILEKFELNQIKELTKDKKFPEFKAGDTLKIHLKVKEGEKERIQIFEGVCIAYKNAGINSAFTVRKISYGEGVERVFPVFSPQISKVEVSKFGDVRRSKLYYLRQRSGKSARITEKNKFLNKKKSTDENKSGNDQKSEKAPINLKKTDNTILTEGIKDNKDTAQGQES